MAAIDACHTCNVRLVELFHQVPLLLTPDGRRPARPHRRAGHGRRPADAHVGVVHLPVQHDPVAGRHGVRRLHRRRACPSGSRWSARSTPTSWCSAPSRCWRTRWPSIGSHPSEARWYGSRSHPGRIAQLVRARASHARGQRFESSYAHPSGSHALAGGNECLRSSRRDPPHRRPVPRRPGAASPVVASSSSSPPAMRRCGIATRSSRTWPRQPTSPTAPPSTSRAPP